MGPLLAGEHRNLQVHDVGAGWPGLQECTATLQERIGVVLGEKRSGIEARGCSCRYGVSIHHRPRGVGRAVDTIGARR